MKQKIRASTTQSTINEIVISIPSSDVAMTDGGEGAGVVFSMPVELLVVATTAEVERDTSVVAKFVFATAVVEPSIAVE